MSNAARNFSPAGDPKLRWYVSADVADNVDWFQAPRTGDAGFDLRAAQDMLVCAGTLVKISTGVHVAIPQGYVGLVKDRSSLAVEGMVSSAGVIDSSYRGEIAVLIRNTATLPFSIHKGDRIAQLIVVPCLVEGGAVAELEELGETSRSMGGFGSTGRA